ncbi:MAG TPA: SagB/ThcOx family dehydrogenase [Longimicrobium sp.]
MVAHWDAGEFLLENYLSHRRVAVPPLVAHLLHGLDGYASSAEIAERLGIPGAAELVAELAAANVLVCKGSDLELQDLAVEERWPWGRAAAFFHYSAQNIVFHEDLRKEAELLAELASAVPPPPVYKDYGAPGLQLPGTQDDDLGGFWDVLRQRRTRRSFSGDAVSLDDFARVLLWTWGRSQVLHDPVFGEYVVKTSPSGGARHPVEVYPLVLRVNGVEPGLYHYSVRCHALSQLRSGFFADEAARLCAGQQWVADAAAVCFMTAVVQRSAWKYRQPHAYRVIHLDAGHLGQTFHLACTALGLAPFTTGASRETEVQQFLEIDGVSEIPMYVAAFGVPATQA